MKHKAFTEIIAHSCQVPAKTVALFARNLKEAGLLTSGARGVNAPEMTVMDLARMLLSVLATERPSDAVEELNWYRALPCFDGGTITMPKYEKGMPTEDTIKLFEVSEGETLEDVLAHVFAAPPIVLTLLSIHLEVKQPSRSVTVWLGDCRLRFLNEDNLKQNHEDQNSPRGIKTTRSLTDHALTEMALPFALENAEGTTWENMVESDSAGAVAGRHIFGIKEGGADA